MIKIVFLRGQFHGEIEVANGNFLSHLKRSGTIFNFNFFILYFDFHEKRYTMDLNSNL